MPLLEPLMALLGEIKLSPWPSFLIFFREKISAKGKRGIDKLLA